MSEGSSSPKRARLDFDDNIKDDHFDKYKNRDQDDQGSYTHPRRKRGGEPDEDDFKESEEGKAKNVAIDTSRREHTLVIRLTNKEQELQECMNQIQEMKQAQTQNTAQLRSMLLDPAINLVFQRMAREMDEHKEKLKQKQNELSAWKFTADSQTGMRLMAKCRMLLQENGELGKMISSGRTARLEGEISLQKALVTEMTKNQKELDEFVGELEEDVESMQGMILMLQQQLKEAREQISRLEQENQQLRTSQIPAEPGGTTKSGAHPEPSWNALLRPAAQVKSSSSPLTHQSSLLTGGLSHSTTEETSLLKAPAIASNNVVSASLSSSVSDFPVTAQTCPSLSPPAFKVTPDSGVQTQEEDISMDATDFLSAEDVPSQDSSHCAPTAPPDVVVAGGLEGETDPQPQSPLPSLQGDGNLAQDSLSPPELEHNSEISSNSLDVLNAHSEENVRTSPPHESSDVLETDPLSNSLPENPNGSVSERTSPSPNPANTNSDELTVDKSDGDITDDNKEVLNRTSSNGGQEVNAVKEADDSEERDEVSKHSECGAVVASKVEGESDIERPFRLGLTNGSSSQ